MTTPATSLLQINLQLDLAPQGNGTLVESLPPNLGQPLHDRFGNTLPGDLHGCIKKVIGKVRRDAACRHDQNTNRRVNDRQFS